MTQILRIEIEETKTITKRKTKKDPDFNFGQVNRKSNTQNKLTSDKPKKLNK